MDLGFTESKADSNLCFKVECGIPVMLLLYVDDLSLTEKVERRRIFFEFEMKDLDMMHYFLGMQVWQSMDGISPRQGKYAMEILKRFGMMECKAMTTPMVSNLKLLSDASSETVDAMMYGPLFCLLMFLMDLRHAHLVAKHVVRYLKDTVECGLKKTNLHGYVDSDW